MVKVEFTGGTSDLYYLQLTYWIAVFHLGHDNTYHRFSGNRGCTLFMLLLQRVKIINPHRKSDVIVRHLHRLNSKFDSVHGLRVHLMINFKSILAT